MSVAACLLLYSIVAAFVGSRVLIASTREGTAPRLSVAAWLALLGSVAGSWLIAAAFLASELVPEWDHAGDVMQACFGLLGDVLTGHHGIVVQSGLIMLTAVVLIAFIRLGWRLARNLWGARRETHRHAELARMVGHRLPGVDAVILDAPERVVYCAAGRPHAVVVTRGALAALDQPQLAAVLTHKRAHLTGRHHLLLAVTRALAQVLPGVRMFTIGAREVARLLEMCADDAAVRRHGRRTLLDALLALSSGHPTPERALSAASVDVAERAERLRRPPGVKDRTLSRAGLLVALSVLATGPLAVAVAGLCVIPAI